jgi:hypothetical protein
MGDYSTAVMWSQPSGQGSISAEGDPLKELYTAPNGPTTAVVNATSSEDPTQGGYGTITVNPDSFSGPSQPENVAVGQALITPVTISGNCGTSYSWTESGGNASVQNGNDGIINDPTNFDNITWSQPGTYQITALDACGNTATVDVDVYPPLCQLSAASTLIIPPQSTDLNWKCQYASSCTLSASDLSTYPPFSTSAGMGTQPVTPSKTTKYTLTCAGFGTAPNDTATSTVIVSIGPGVQETQPQ